MEPILQVRLAHPEEMPTAMQEADSTGSDWARRHEENFPAKVARECGIRRFEVAEATDFFQAVNVPVSMTNEALFECLRVRGSGYLRLSIISPESR